MSHLVKKLTVIAIAMFVLLSMSAFAQSDSNISLIAKADKASKPGKPMAAAPQHTAAKSSQNWMTHRFEISLQGGGVIGGNMGRTSVGSCKSAANLGGGFTDGCDPNQNLDIENDDGIYEQNISGIRAFQRF